MSTRKNELQDKIEEYKSKFTDTQIYHRYKHLMNESQQLWAKNCIESGGVTAHKTAREFLTNEEREELEVCRYCLLSY